MEFETISRQSAHEAIVERIERAVDEGLLRPGDRLPSERRLMEQFGVSRPTVREAMRVLQATGVVAAHPGDPRGPEILAYSPAVFEKSLARLAAVDTMSRVEILQFRVVIEANGSLLAAHNRTEDDLREIRAAHRELQAAAERADGGFGAAADSFQAAIRRASHNQLVSITGGVLAGVVRALIDRRLADETDVRRRLRASERYASAVLAAIVAGDGPTAAREVTLGIHAYYAGHLDPAEQDQLALLLGET
ncbi:MULTISPECIES: FadR/GntR family transcriptional regulator [Pseudonocardia]|uniref:Pyruvate dehydrogenase complex repressor n=2 Tax=Pseudonocardia TaxID=1847 RepID=A0A1Y2MT35_PSEAH|nr:MULTISPECIES: GntR family transcriptional regulator [Pseudonocardia]OSY38370.1 Pyruvate dehydrogenase complex repressor [Pseudonocardia autotrophica]TDN72585.1 DNA-binding FadR family transcriptional regulator [Pseudonocardia autotrophica]BBG03294.1 GntR family transcriptional regulator [Pseudonocardia autotrophica]GEC24552.1 GntR family transcriptional regulator [Pseudonocardia saturnea]